MAEICVWVGDEDGVWESSCGDAWCLEDGTPSENKMKFCHGCGKRLVEQVYVAEPDEEEEGK